MNDQPIPNTVTAPGIEAKILREEFISPESIPHLTICVLVLTNGFAVTGEAAPADKSYELWAVEGETAPKSLGVVDASLSRTMTVPASGQLTLAISLEPKGGSPTGVATGPILYTGSLVPAE